MAISAMGKRLIREVGSPEDIYQTLITFRREIEELARQRQRLTRKHPNKWIAFHGGEVVCVADSLDDLLNSIDRNKLPRGQVITQFLGKDKITMAL